MLYAGIGSRKTPPDVLKRMSDLGKFFAVKGLILRSGGADVADSAFEAGCDLVNGPKEIWLPYAGYNGNHKPKHFPDDMHHWLAARYHPNYKNLTKTAAALHARNMGQILGVAFTKPVSFVVCWTPDGCDSLNGYSRQTGGTGTAICCASDHGIPVFNMNTMDFKDSFEEFIKDVIFS